MNRREFLKTGGVGALGLLFLPNRLWGTLEQLGAREQLSLKEAFENPLLMIDVCCEKIRENADGTDFFEKRFLNLFSNNPPDPEFRQQAEGNRNILQELYGGTSKKAGIGEKAYNFYLRALGKEAVERFSWAKDFWIWGEIFSRWKQGKLYSDEDSFVKIWMLESLPKTLLRLVAVGEVLTQYETYEEQKKVFINSAREANEKNPVPLDPKFGEGLSFFVNELKDCLPGSLSPLVTGFVYKPEEWGSFEYETGIVHLGGGLAGIFRSVKMLHAYAQSGEALGVIHEISHGSDHNRQISYANFHPDDVLSYTESYIEMLENFYLGIDKTLSSKQIKGILRQYYWEPATFSFPLSREFIDQLSALHTFITKGQGAEIMEQLGLNSLFGEDFPIRIPKEDVIDFNPNDTESRYIFFYFIALRRFSVNGVLPAEFGWLYQTLKRKVEEQLFHILTGPTIADRGGKQSALQKIEQVRREFRRAGVDSDLANWIFSVIYNPVDKAERARLKMWGGDQTGLVVQGEKDPSMALVRFLNKVASATA